MSQIKKFVVPEETSLFSMSNIQYPMSNIQRGLTLWEESILSPAMQDSDCANNLKFPFASSNQDYLSASTRVGHWILVIDYWTLIIPCPISNADQDCR